MSADDTLREQIIDYIVTEIDAVSAIKKVVRRLQSYSELTTFPSTHFPAVAVVGRLPTPQEKYTGRRMGEIDFIISELKIDLYVYFMDNKTPDSTVSHLLNELWKALYADQNKGGLVLTTELKPRERQEVWDPYGAFMLSVVTTYKHSPTGGI